AFRIGSRVTQWNGVEMHLGFVPQLIAGEPYFHALDMEKSILPLLNSFSPTTNASRVIVLDPGHGGTDLGAINICDGRGEKEFTLDLAYRLRALLATNGWAVCLTRTNDEQVSLARRVAFAEAAKADLFVSLHFNSAAPNREQ